MEVIKETGGIIEDVKDVEKRSNSVLYIFYNCLYKHTIDPHESDIIIFPPLPHLCFWNVLI